MRLCMHGCRDVGKFMDRRCFLRRRVESRYRTVEGWKAAVHHTTWAIRRMDRHATFIYHPTYIRAHMPNQVTSSAPAIM